jgi:alkylation response protein AidB-like acyl-CoA dehydrogenase
MGTLGHERVGTAGLAITMKADLDSMINLARATNPDALRDPELRERIARAYTDVEYTRLLNYRALSKILKGEPNWPEVPLAKLQWSHLAQTLAELACDLLGPAAVLGRDATDAVDGGAWNRLYVFQRYTSIGAGTTEVQKNIIADKAIKLPRA